MRWGRWCRGGAWIRHERCTVPKQLHHSTLNTPLGRRILDCDEGYEWCLFYYSGAASTAGLSYSGAVLATRNGAMPSSAGADSRLEAALERAGIKTWELLTVDNSPSALDGAPLAFA